MRLHLQAVCKAASDLCNPGPPNTSLFSEILKQPRQDFSSPQEGPRIRGLHASGIVTSGIIHQAEAGIHIERYLTDLEQSRRSRSSFLRRQRIEQLYLVDLADLV